MSDLFADLTPTPDEPTGDEPAVEDAQGADGFDRERILRLLDRLEQDAVAVETAMVHAESGDHEAFALAVSTLEPHLHD